MKKIKWLPVALFCVLAFVVQYNSNATSVIVPASINPASETWMNLEGSELIKLSIKDYTRITGKKMNLKEKIAFTIAKKRRKHDLKQNPNLPVSDFSAAKKKISTGWLILMIVGSIALTILFIYAIYVGFP